MPPLVTDDGFGLCAIVSDEATDCHLWQGDWTALCSIVADETFADVAAGLGVSRQCVGQLVDQTRRALTRYGLPRK